MPSLSDKLKALGVKVGAADTPPPQTRRFPTLEEALNGQARLTHLGETFVVEAFYPTGQPYGNTRLEISASLQGLANWANTPDLAGLLPQAFAFLDTETTGLSGGTGTYAFLIGMGRFEADSFHLLQVFLRDPLEEPAQLAMLEEFLAPCQAIVTFNGKSFDLPLLYTRFTSQGWRAPFGELIHLDLLHLARRLWAERLPSRSLGNLEAQILGAQRTQEDLPGWMIPQIYFDYLRDGDPQPLKRVFYHNTMDVLSMTALLDHMAGVLVDPVGRGGQYGVDLIALAKLYESLGDHETAASLYVHGLEHSDVQNERLPRHVLLDALLRLALLHKRQGEWQMATRLWEQAAAFQHLNAHLELAKCYEHHLLDITLAFQWTRAAIELVQSPDGPLASQYERRQWLEELQHRLERLERKLRK